MLRQALITAARSQKTLIIYARL